MQLSTISQAATMSSREIAELTEKQHQHVLRDIRNMLAELEEDESKYGRIYKDTMNREQVEIALPRDLTDCLLTGYSAKARMRVIKRWKELEEQFKVPTTLSAALRLAADQAEKIESQALQLQHQQPAVEFVDRYTVATGLKGVREVCKILKANERQFVDWMTESGIMYRLAGRLTPYQPHIDAGRFLVKTGLSGDGHAFSSPKFTAKGVSWVAGEWGRFQVSGRG